MLLGIPEEDQEELRDGIDAGLSLEDGRMPERRRAGDAAGPARRASPSTSTGGASTPPTT
jgi:hypothetical protein